MINTYNRKYKPKKYKFDQLGLKGLDKPDVSRRPDFGKSNNFELLPHDFKDEPIAHSKVNNEED